MQNLNKGLCCNPFHLKTRRFNKADATDLQQRNIGEASNVQEMELTAKMSEKLKNDSSTEGGLAKIYYYEISLHAYSPLSFISLLSQEERIKASFYTEKSVRNRYIIGRGVLRCILSQWLNVPAKELCIAMNSWGKPSIPGIHFNLSHAEDKMILCLSFEVGLGVDIEKIHQDAWVQDIEEMLFSRKEKEHAASMSPEFRLRYFFLVWTKKEAWLKAMGLGMNMDLRLLNTEEDLLSWHFHFLAIDGPYVACLATQRKECHVSRCTVNIDRSAQNNHYL